MVAHATFVGNAMAAVVQGVSEVSLILNQPPVIIGGLAVLSRLSTPYRATVDLDVVDRMLQGRTPQLRVLRAADGAMQVEPAGVLLPTSHGQVRVDVLEVRQPELDRPSDDPGDRLHAAAHAWAYESATDVMLGVQMLSGELVEATAPVAEPGPLVAMKLQALEDRPRAKQGTDLRDILNLVLDPATRPSVLDQTAGVDDVIARDIDLHVERWLVQRSDQVLRLIRAVGGTDISIDDIDLVAELLTAAAHHRRP